VKYSTDIWEDTFSKKEWGKYPPLALVRFVALNYYSRSPRSEVKILELGSGTGANLWYMAKEGITVYGIEGSSVAVERTIKRFKDENLEQNIGKIFSGNYCHDLNFDNNHFDAIIDIESLYCNPFNQTKELLSNCFKKLKVGGKLFSMTFADGTWGFEGEEVDYHGVNGVDGIMKDLGYGRFTTKEDIEKLYLFPNTKLTNLERQDRSLMNGKSIKEWIIEIEKIN